jgi:hypothetical protein
MISVHRFRVALGTGGIGLCLNVRFLLFQYVNDGLFDRLERHCWELLIAE